jgi:hypothetical protein
MIEWRSELLGWLLALRNAARAERAYAVISCTFVCGSVLAGWAVGWPGLVGAAELYRQTLSGTVLYLVGYLVYDRCRSANRSVPAGVWYPATWRRLRSHSRERLASYALVVATFPLVLAGYSGWKIWSNEVHAFAYDASLHALDGYLHAGRQPWEWLQPILGFPWVTRLLEVLYLPVWAVTINFVMVRHTFSAPSSHRSRFLIASALAWPIAGGVINGLLPAAGPAFYSLVRHGEHAYFGLEAYLRGATPISPAAQDALWRMYRDHMAMPGSGIGAMPSMHLVAATVVAAGTRHWGKWWCLSGIMFVLVVFVGSVHLGWHYAVDGYIGVILGLALWQVSSWLQSVAQTAMPVAARPRDGLMSHLEVRMVADDPGATRDGSPRSSR